MPQARRNNQHGHASEETFQAMDPTVLGPIFARHPDAMYWLTPVLRDDELVDLEVRVVNGAGAALMRMTQEQVLGQRLSRLLREGQRNQWLEDARDAWNEGGACEFRFELVDSAKLLRTRWIDLSLQRLNDGMLVVVRDVTREQELERRVAEVQRQLEQTQSIANVGSYTFDLRMERFWWSDQTFRILGLAPTRAAPTFEEMLSLVHTSDREALQQAAVESNRTGQDLNLSFRVVRPDGSVRHLRIKAENHRTETGEMVERVGTVQDVTDILQQEARVRSSEDMRRRIGQHAPVVFFATDRNGIVQHTEGKGLEAQGLGPEAVIGNSIFEVYQDYPDFLANIRQALDGEAVVCVNETRGRIFQRWLEPVLDDRGALTGLVGVALDVTDRELAERELAQSRALLQAIFDTFPARICVTDNQGKTILCNRARPPEDDGRDTGEAVGTGEAAGLVEPQPAAHGEPYDCPRQVAAVLQLGETFDEERQRTDAKGQERHERVLRVPLRGQDGATYGALSVVLDITKRKVYEAQLRQAQKMEAVGQLASGVAHDFNNLLQLIYGYGELAEMENGGNPGVSQQIQQILAATDSAAQLTQQLLAFSRNNVLKRRRMSLNQAVLDLTKMVGRLLGEHIELRNELTPETTCIEADRGMIEQVLMNLCVNGRDAMPSGGTLRLTTGVATLDEGQCGDLELPEAGAYVWLKVADTGIGMAPEVLERIFEPFFTTKAEGHGTGLGLATNFGIVRQHGGSIRVESSLGQVACFTVYLPACIAAPEEFPRRGPAPLRRGDETLLVLEDDVTVLGLLVNLLQSQGYRVLSALDAEAAVALFQQHQDEVALVILDAVVPKGNAADIAQRLKGIRNDCRIVLSTGCASGESSLAFIEAHGPRVLEKPYSPHALFRTVREELDRP